MKDLKVLISGASIAGLTAAYWLDKNRFTVTVVEKSKEIKGGGYPIDVRGSAIKIVKKMRIFDGLKKSSLNNMKFSFLNDDGSKQGEFFDDEMKDEDDIEISRGVLTNYLYETVKNKNIDFYFNDSIKEMYYINNKVSVELESGKKEYFDIVIGADGIHSHTRGIKFGDESNYSKYLGFCFTGFSMKNDLNLYKEGLIYSKPGETAILYGTEDLEKVHAFLVFYDDEEPFINHSNTKQHIELITNRFKDMKSITPKMIDSMNKTNDLFFDTTTQIIMNNWSKDRVILVGDAAYAPSLLTGQGSSLAIVGSYILANELSKKDNIEDAFLTYERILKPFVETNQNVVGKDSFSIVNPKNSQEIELRNKMLMEMENNPKRNDENSNLNTITRNINYPGI